MALVMALVLSACQATSMLDITGSVAPAGASASASGHVASARASGGLGAMRADQTLERAAMRQAAYMARAGRMAHDTGWRRDFATRMRAEGVPMAAENIAHGRMDLDRLFAMWMNSPGHRKNMLDPRFQRYGLARAPDPADPSRSYWALVVAP